MKAIAIKALLVTASVLALNGCKSTGSRYVYQPVTSTHPELQIEDNRDYSWDEKASLAMNAKDMLNVDMKVIDAMSAEDSVRYYSTGERVAGTIIDYAGGGIMGAVAEMTTTGDANDEASSARPFIGVFVDNDMIDREAMQSTFLAVRDEVGERIFNAVKTDLPDAVYHGSYTTTHTTKYSAGMVLIESSRCLELDKQYGYKGNPLFENYLLDYDGNGEGFCRIGFWVRLMDIEDSALSKLGANGKSLIKVAVGGAEYLYPTIAKNIDDGFVVMPFRFETSNGKTVITNNYPFVGFEGEAHLFTKNSDTTHINTSL